MFSSYIKAAVSNPTFKRSKSSYSQPSEDLLEGNSQVITISQQLALPWHSAAALLLLQLLSRSPQMPQGRGAPGPWVALKCALSPSNLCCDGLAQKNKRIRSYRMPHVWNNSLKIVLAVQSPAHWAMENMPPTYQHCNLIRYMKPPPFFFFFKCFQRNYQFWNPSFCFLP